MCIDGRTRLSVLGRLGGLAGVIARGGDDEPDEDASEFRDLAFPLLYTPGGTGIPRNNGSWSIVGIPGRSEYVKYAVKCHFRGFALTESTTQAEYACFTRPSGCLSLRS